MRLPLCLVQLLPLFAYGLNPNQRISQYGHTAWRLQDGYFTGSPNSITQTKDGYLWIATINGLFRFDGVNFTAFQPPSGKQLPSRLIVDVLAASDGSLWFTSGGLLEHWQDNNLTSYKPDGPTRRANAILQAKDGGIWVVYSRQPSGSPLCRVDGLKLRCYGDSDGVPLPYATAIAEDADRQIWISGGSRIEKWKPGYSQIYSPPGIGPLELTLAVSVIRSDPDGSMWVGMLTKGPGLGLQHVVRGEWHPLVLPGFDSSNLQVNEVLRDREGSLWIGTDGQGVYRVHDGQVDNYRASSGLSSDSVGSVFEDGEGDIWVGTSKGLDKFRDIAVTTFTSSEGLGSSAVNSVASSRDGGIWSGDGTHLDRLHPGEVSSIDRSAGLPGTGVTALLEDHLGNLWLGVDDKLFKYSAGKFAVVNKASGASIGLVFDLVEDTDGVIWVAENSVSHNVFRWSPSAGSSEVPLPQSRSVHSLQADPHGGVWFAFADGDLGFFRNGRWEMVPLPRGPKRNPIHQLVIDAGGAVLGAAPSGVIGWHGGRAQTLGTDNGLPCGSAYSLLLDAKQNLWVYAECGLLYIAKSEVERWWQHPGAKLDVRVFDILDGVQPALPIFHPGAAKSLDGKLWFANSVVLQRLDPTDLPKNIVVPPVHIEAFIADKIGYSVQAVPRLPALTRDLQIDYTALSFPIPQRVRFRYRLDGIDTEWQDVSNRRQAFYTSLKPGTYTFHVIACNNDGVWNETGAAIKFSVAPTYYQTMWFQLLCAGAIAGLLWIAYLARLRYVTDQIQRSLGTRMEERERIARELHDTLLQGVQGLMLRFQSLMRRLPEQEPVRQMMGQVLDRADEVLLEGRQRVRDLRAEGITADGLGVNVRRCGEELAQDYPVAFYLTITGAPQVLDPTVSNEVYQIAREALTNAFQHSKGSRVEARIIYHQASLRVVVIDDGRGIEEGILDRGRAGHWGVAGMRERAQKIGAKLDFRSHADRGTEIDLAVPAWLAYYQNGTISVRRRVGRALAKLGRRSSP